MKEKVEILSQLFRSVEIDVGTRDMSMLVLESFLEALKSFTPKDEKDFEDQLKQWRKALSKTEPKFGVLNNNFGDLLREFCKEIKGKDYNLEKWKSIAAKKADEILKYRRSCKKDLIKYIDKVDIEGKTILIHDHSHTVQDALVHYKYKGKHFRVVVAEQDYEKTHSNIERLHNARIPFQVIPSYMISHAYDRIDMAFFGAVTLKDTMNFVMAPGTHAITSALHLANVELFLFIDTNKFSLWKSKKRGEIFIRKHKRTHHNKPIEYERIKYSHDRVPASVFSKVVTNEGVFGPRQIKKLFLEKLKQKRR